MALPGSLRPLRTVSRKTGQAVPVSRHTAQALLIPHVRDRRRETRLFLSVVHQGFCFAPTTFFNSLGNPSLLLITAGHDMVCQLSVWRGSAHDEYTFSFICFLPLSGSKKISCHKAPDKGQRGFRLSRICGTIHPITRWPSLRLSSLSDVSLCLVVKVFSLLFTRNG